MRSETILSRGILHLGTNIHPMTPETGRALPGEGRRGTKETFIIGRDQGEGIRRDIVPDLLIESRKKDLPPNDMMRKDGDFLIQDEIKMSKIANEKE